MTRRKEVPPKASQAPGASEEAEGRREVAEAVITLLESRYCPPELSDLVADHVIKLSEATHLYIFAPEVVRAVYPLMCERGAALEEERQKEQRKERRGKRTPRSSKAKGEPPPAETDSVN